MAEPRFSFDVFLSHNSQDKPRVRRLAQRLRAAGLRVWFDEGLIRPGDDIYLAVERGLEISRTLVLCMSPNAFGSDWVTLERGTALFRDPVNKDRCFIPLLLADCTLPDTLRRYKYVDFRTEDEAALQELVVACRAGVPFPPPPAPPVSKPGPTRPGPWWKPSGKMRAGVLAAALVGGGISARYLTDSPAQQPSPPPPEPPVAAGAAQAQGEAARREAESLLPMVSLPGGWFWMGSRYGDSAASAAEKPRHKVTVPAFAIGKYEVTQRAWRWVMRDNPSSFKACGEDCPVEKVSFNEVQEFIKELNAKTGQQYRLPSEAEWEYACRANQGATYCGGDDLDAVAWHRSNADGKTHPVGGKAANPFGLHDMSGNVWEWTADCWHGNYQAAPENGSAWMTGGCGRRVVRGGSWDSVPVDLRSAYRDWFIPDFRYFLLGFRLAQDL